MKIVLNIGLNVCQSEPTAQLNKTLNNLTERFLVRNFKVVEGKYKDSEGVVVEERTLVVEVYLHNPSIDVPIYLKTLAYVLEQECIAYIIDNKQSGLAYKNGYFGEQQKFNKSTSRNCNVPRGTQPLNSID